MGHFCNPRTVVKWLRDFWVQLFYCRKTLSDSVSSIFLLLAGRMVFWCGKSWHSVSCLFIVSFQSLVHSHSIDSRVKLTEEPLQILFNSCNLFYRKYTLPKRSSKRTSGILEQRKSNGSATKMSQWSVSKITSIKWENIQNTLSSYFFLRLGSSLYTVR